MGRRKLRPLDHPGRWAGRDDCAASSSSIQLSTLILLIDGNGQWNALSKLVGKGLVKGRRSAIVPTIESRDGFNPLISRWALRLCEAFVV